MTPRLLAASLFLLAPSPAAWADEAPIPPSSDVVAQRTVRLPPEAVTAAFADLEHAAGLFDGDCLRRWSFGVPAAGKGASARVSYVPGPMNRRLLLEVSVVEPGRRVEWEHAGPKGFTTRLSVRAAGEGSEVTLTTYLSEPPWFVRHTFHDVVQPAWAACYAQALVRLDGPAVP